MRLIVKVWRILRFICFWFEKNPQGIRVWIRTRVTMEWISTKTGTRHWKGDETIFTCLGDINRMKYLQERLEECGIVIKFWDQLQLCAINEWEIVRRYQHHGDVGQVYNSGHILQEGRSGHQNFDRNGFKWEDHIIEEYQVVVKRRSLIVSLVYGLRCSPGLSSCRCLYTIRVAYTWNPTVCIYQHTLADSCGTAESILS